MRTESNIGLAASRRRFLKTAFGTLALTGLLRRPAFAEPQQLAARIAETPESHVLAAPLRRAAKALSDFESVQDYQATFVRQELVGKSLIKSRMALKLRHDPFSVYVKYLEPNAGREAIYVEGQHDNLVLAHETGFASLVGTLRLDPKGKLAMEGNRYPITMIGIRKMVESVIEQWLQFAASEDVKVNFYPDAKIADQSCQVYETLLAAPVNNLAYQTIRLYFDAESGLPIRSQSYGFAEKNAAKPPLLEDYHYQSLKMNVGLSNSDFDTANFEYNY
ncbi:MAG: DUF1571 domain-containing protein [Planctomyces sp.]|nr:DUF1571 domain-containing protein [Planctomyces sp.]